MRIHAHDKESVTGIDLCSMERAILKTAGEIIQKKASEKIPFEDGQCYFDAEDVAAWLIDVADTQAEQAQETAR